MLEKLCRVCGRSVTTKSTKTNYPCKQHLDDLERVFGLSARMDDPDMYPTHFCHSCKRAISKAGHNIVQFDQWCTHEDTNCTVCEYYGTLQRGGRPPKTNRTPGRPLISLRYCIQHIKNVAPKPFTASDEKIAVCESHISVPASQFNCPLCHQILTSPVQLTCGNVVCADCLCSRLHQQNSLACPCCNSDHLEDYNTITSAPPLVVNVIGGLCIVCTKCHIHIQLKDYHNHLTNSCIHSPAPIESIEDVLCQPSTTPLTPLEQKLQTNLARRSLTCSEEGVLRLKTGGKVYREEVLLIHYICTITILCNPATDLCTSEAGPDYLWKGSTKDCPPTLPVHGECTFHSGWWG